MHLSDYDIILINTSGGKDSQAMLSHIHALAQEWGLEDRLIAVHADLGRVEWPGTAELAQKQAELLGIRFIKTPPKPLDLLERIEQRGMFPDAARRWCTSDFKRSEIQKIFTALVREKEGRVGLPVRILSCMGLRAQESPARRKKLGHELELNERASNGRREVWEYLPILRWTEMEVWDRIEVSGLPYHEAYDHGMPRLSCMFCIFASKSALMIAGEHNPELLDEYCRVEDQIGHSFRQKMRINEIRDALRKGERAKKGEGWEA